MLIGIRTADRLREDADHVVEVRRRPESAVEPRRVRRAPPLRHAGLSFGEEALEHHRPDDVDAGDRVGMLVVVERIPEGRREHDRALRSCLMVVVHDLRVPLAIHHAIDVGGLGERRHVEVPIVVVPRVLVVENGDVHVPVLHVPVRDEVHAVRVDEHAQLDDVVQEAHGLFVGSAHHLPHVLQELLGAEGFGGVQSAVDPHHRLALFGEGSRRVVGEPLGVGKSARNCLVARKLLVICRGGDDGHEHRPPLRALADIDDVQARRLFFELLPVRNQLLVVGEEVVVADVVPPLGHGRGQTRRSPARRGCSRRGGRDLRTRRTLEERDGKEHGRKSSESSGRDHRASLQNPSGGV